jgi:hypothetical protein
MFMLTEIVFTSVTLFATVEAFVFITETTVIKIVINSASKACLHYFLTFFTFFDAFKTNIVLTGVFFHESVFMVIYVA